MSFINKIKTQNLKWKSKLIDNMFRWTRRIFSAKSLKFFLPAEVTVLTSSLLQDLPFQCSFVRMYTVPSHRTSRNQQHRNIHTYRHTYIHTGSISSYPCTSTYINASGAYELPISVPVRVCVCVCVHVQVHAPRKQIWWQKNLSSTDLIDQ